MGAMFKLRPILTIGANNGFVENLISVEQYFVLGLIYVSNSTKQKFYNKTGSKKN